MELIDIGANLTHDSFDKDLESVVENAHTAGVAQFIVTGASAEGMQKAQQLASTYPGVMYATAGVHPHRADTWNKDMDALVRRLVTQDEVVAVGETGLDYFRDFSPRDLQRESFQAHIEIAAETGLPMFLHLRDAHEDFNAILKSERGRLSDVVVHCFTGSKEELAAYLDLDCHIGITGWICDERRGTHMKEYLPDIPANRLMIETDAPYLKPRNLRPLVKSHRNEPRWLPWILGTLAAARNENPEWLAEQTTTNARRFFGIPGPAGVPS